MKRILGASILLAVLVGVSAPSVLAQTTIIVAAQPPQARVYNSGNVSTSLNTSTPIPFDSERWDTDGMHFTSAANLTGTVSKNGTTTLTGSSTLFLSELSVGQVISVPGTNTEWRVVTAIASNTSLTVSTAFTKTASGQTATRRNECLVARTAGLYEIKGHIEFAANNSGVRYVHIKLNWDDLTDVELDRDGGWTNSSSAPTYNVSTQWRMNQWDFVTLNTFQNAGTLNVDASLRYSPEFMMARVSQ